ncbi:MAG: hypothetical protein A4E31_00177 [Methanomassiliicoccales archaeon PtaU1.Bin030]|nr:MAG: hypothetical protein A4E31_00177 [Methanomassiliicoccales archaeon PtaU1.Bin030]
MPIARAVPISPFLSSPSIVKMLMMRAMPAMIENEPNTKNREVNMATADRPSAMA